MSLKTRLLTWLELYSVRHPEMANVTEPIMVHVEDPKTTIDPATIIAIISAVVSAFLAFQNGGGLTGIITTINTVLAQLGWPPIPVPPAPAK